MKISFPAIAAAIILCLYITTFSESLARAADDTADLGICEFTTAAPKMEKDKPPQYKAASEIQCGKFTELYAVCRLPKPIGEYQGDVVNAKFVFNDVNPDARHIARELKPDKNADNTARAWVMPYENCEQPDCSDKKPVETDIFHFYEQTTRPMSGMESGSRAIIYGLIPNDKAAVTMRGWMTPAETCELTGRSKNKPVNVEVFISAGVRTGTKKQKGTDDTGAEIEIDMPVYDWTKIASGRMKIIPEGKKKTPQPPNWESVKDELRSYWPTRFPGFEFIDGYPTDAPRAESMSGYTIFTYSLSVIVADETGTQTTCSINNAAVKLLDTGGIVVHNIEFDRFQDCTN